MKSRKNYFITFCGIAFVIGGICLISSFKTPNEWTLVLPYICIGVGCGVFGHGMGNLLRKRLEDVILNFKSKWKFFKRMKEI